MRFLTEFRDSLVQLKVLKNFFRKSSAHKTLVSCSISTCEMWRLYFCLVVVAVSSPAQASMAAPPVSEIPRLDVKNNSQATSDVKPVLSTSTTNNENHTSRTNNDHDVTPKAKTREPVVVLEPLNMEVGVLLSSISLPAWFGF